MTHRIYREARKFHDLPAPAPAPALAAACITCCSAAQRSGAVDRTARDVDVFEAKTLPPDPGRYRQAG